MMWQKYLNQRHENYDFSQKHAKGIFSKLFDVAFFSQSEICRIITYMYAINENIKQP